MPSSTMTGHSSRPIQSARCGSACPNAVEHLQFGLDQDALRPGCCWYVSVKRTGPHTRARAAFWASPLHQPGQLSEAACAVLFEQLAMAAHEGKSERGFSEGSQS
jgi:hypothetical protein